MRCVTTAILVLGMVGCSNKVVDAPAADYSITLTTPYGPSHGCYVEGKLYTARHVVQPFGRPPVNAAWRDGYGNEGLAVLRAISSFGDLAMLEIVSGEPYLNHPKSRAEVEPGTVLAWFEYSYQSVPDAFRAKYRKATVTRAIGGVLVLDKLPVPGASGTCVFDEEGAVVGLIVWGHEVGVGLVARIHD